MSLPLSNACRERLAQFTTFVRIPKQSLGDVGITGFHKCLNLMLGADVVGWSDFFTRRRSVMSRTASLSRRRASSGFTSISGPGLGFIEVVDQGEELCRAK